MRQFNPATTTEGGDASSSNGRRRLWRTARERKRLQARFVIRERVNNGRRLLPIRRQSSQDLLQAERSVTDDDANNNTELVVVHESSSSAAATTPCTNKTSPQQQQIRNQAEPPKDDDDADDDIIVPLLHRIIENDRSFFSVTYLAENEALVSRLFSTACLWVQNENDDDKNSEGEKSRCLLGEEKLVSWYGHDGVKKELYAYLDDAVERSFTLMEYALLFQRYFIVGSFILGGINPCRRRGRYYTCCHDIEKSDCVASDDNDERLHRVGEQVLRRFFLDPVPLPLSSYMVKRTFDLRRTYWKKLQLERDDSSVARHEQGAVVVADDSATMGNLCRCTVCARIYLPSLLLCFPSCQHVVCEACFWKSLLETLDDRREDEDVVQCQVCRNEQSTNTTTTPSSSSPALTPKDRFERSRRLYLNLPLDARELKAQHNGSTSKGKKNKKRGKQNGRFILASTWSDAIRPSLGVTQQVRRDKFFVHVERGSFHYVRTCLEVGIDVNLQNEYGQTALYICAWRGFDLLVKLLLQYGADPRIHTNGTGMTVLRVAASSGHEECYNLILRQHIMDNSNTCSSSSLDENNTPRYESPTATMRSASPLDIDLCRLETLIPETADHPGAGSYLLHDILSDAEIDELVDLWKSIPTAPPDEVKEKKGKPCSVRSYFCDAEHQISRLLMRALGSFQQAERQQQPSNGDVKDVGLVAAALPVVLPHMRFLCYHEAGAVLAPHVDLNRVEFVAPNSCDRSPPPRRSTHSFLLYLTDCHEGGETTLLGSLSGKGRDVVRARIKPRRGHLLLFPHNCPHQGEEVVDVPKLLIRGEVILPL